MMFKKETQYPQNKVTHTLDHHQLSSLKSFTTIQAVLCNICFCVHASWKSNGATQKRTYNPAAI